MNWICPNCRKPTAEVTHSAEVGPDGDDDEVTVQLVKCGDCNFSGIAVYRENRRGRLDSEHWRHDGYRLAPNDMTQLQAALEDNSVLENYGRQGANSCWSFEANGLQVIDRWPIELAPSEPPPRIEPTPSRALTHTPSTANSHANPTRAKDLLQDTFYLATLLAVYFLLLRPAAGRTAILLPIYFALGPVFLWQIILGRREWNTAPRWWKVGSTLVTALGFLLGVVVAAS